VSLVFHWFLPTSGDGRGIVGRGHSIPLAGATARPPALATGARAAGRPPDIEYLGQIARSAEQLGFTGVLTPTGTWCEDAWLTTAALISQTQRLKFLVAFRPGFVAPTLAAQMAATYQRLSRGRLLLNVVTGGEDAEQRRFGDYLSHDERYARTGEFLDIVRGAWSGRPYDFEGAHYKVEGATVMASPDPVPTVYFGGSSPAAGPVAARYVDVYLTWGEPPDLVARKIARMRELADEAGRSLRFGIRLHTISRDTAKEAWAEANRMLAELTAAEIATSQQALAKSVSVGQQTMRGLHEAYRDRGKAQDLEIYPNLWAGVGLVRGGAGTALVGSHAEVADRIQEYAALGIEEFIMSGYPHLEEAYWFGEGVLPELRSRGASTVRAATTLDSTVLDSTALDGTVLDDTALDGTALDDTALDDTVLYGTEPGELSGLLAGA
jgi:alkanesulfonate monooxygenase